MKTADQPLQRPPAALTRSSCRAEWIGTAQDGASQQAPRTDVDASAELSDREKFVRALSRDSAQGAPRGENRESSAVMRRRQVKRLGYQAPHIPPLALPSLHYHTFEFTYRSRDLGVAIPAGAGVEAVRGGASSAGGGDHDRGEDGGGGASAAEG